MLRRSTRGFSDLYDAERIVGKRGTGTCIEYKIRWSGFPDPKDDSWVPLKDCFCPILINEFEQRYKTAAGRQKATASPSQFEFPRLNKLTDTLQSSVPINHIVINIDENLISANPYPTRLSLKSKLVRAKPAFAESQRSPIRNEPKMLPVMPPTDVTILPFQTKQVLGFVMNQSQLKLLVLSSDDVVYDADIKSAAYQNLDVTMDFITNSLAAVMEF